MVKPVLPPAYDLLVIAGERDAFDRACEFARTSVEDGLLVWNERRDRLQMAVLLEPEAALPITLQALSVFVLALGDALGGFTAPALPLALRWPNIVLVDGMELARARCTWAEPAAAGDIPAWLVLGLDMPLHEPPEPGREPDRWTLEGAAGGSVAPAEIVAQIGRHFLLWTDRWQREGFAPIARAWNQRLDGKGRVQTFELGGVAAAGIVEGIDNEGRLLIGGRRLGLYELQPQSLSRPC